MNCIRFAVEESPELLGLIEKCPMSRFICQKCELSAKDILINFELQYVNPLPSVKISVKRNNKSFLEGIGGGGERLSGKPRQGFEKNEEKIDTKQIADESVLTPYWLLVYDFKIGLNPLYIDYVIAFIKNAFTLVGSPEESGVSEELMQLMNTDVNDFQKYVLQTETNEKIVEKSIILKNQQRQIKEQNKSLKLSKKESKIRSKNKKKKSRINSKNARGFRGCDVVKELLKDLRKNNLNATKIKLWNDLMGRNGDEIYVEEEKLHHEGCACNPFGLKAFYPKVGGKKVIKKRRNSS